MIARAGGREPEVTELLALAHARLEDDDYERARTWALESKRGDAAMRERAREVFARLGAQLDLDKLDDRDDVR